MTALPYSAPMPTPQRVTVEKSETAAEVVANAARRNNWPENWMDEVDVDLLDECGFPLYELPVRLRTV